MKELEGLITEEVCKILDIKRLGYSIKKPLLD